MGVRAGAVVTLDVEKPVAGGRMLARLDGQVILVAGAIPGERVSARIGRTGKGLAHADTIDVLSPSPDRRPAADGACGGNLFAHVAYGRQRQMKGAIIRDALSRLGRIALDADPEVIESPEHGYRLRARLHVQRGRVGFYREGTHDVCAAASAGQLAPGTLAWIADVEAHLATLDADVARRLVAIEVGETIAGDTRAAHLVLEAGASRRPFEGLAGGLAGLSAQAGEGRVVTMAGTPALVDRVRAAEDGAGLTLRRDVRAFFQGNRFLVEPLARAVLARLPAGRVIDLYAGVGLFGLLHASVSGQPVVLVEGDPVSGADLQRNAEAFGAQVTVVRRSVESYLAGAAAAGEASVVIDPPRTGLSKEALSGLLAIRPGRVVSVSCDVATFARDARALTEAGYRLDDLVGIDLFPNTAHVETLATFTRARG